MNSLVSKSFVVVTKSFNSDFNSPQKFKGQSQLCKPSHGSKRIIKVATNSASTHGFTFGRHSRYNLGATSRLSSLSTDKAFKLNSFSTSKRLNSSTCNASFEENFSGSDDSMEWEKLQDEQLAELSRLNSEFNQVINFISAEAENTESEKKLTVLSSLKKSIETTMEAVERAIQSEIKFTNMLSNDISSIGLDSDFLSRMSEDSHSLDESSLNETVQNLKELNSLIDDSSISEKDKYKSAISNIKKILLDMDYTLSEFSNAEKYMENMVKDVNAIMNETDIDTSSFSKLNTLTENETILNENKMSSNQNLNRKNNEENAWNPERLFDFDENSTESSTNLVNANVSNIIEKMKSEIFAPVVTLTQEEKEELVQEATQLKSELQSLADEVLTLWNQGKKYEALDLTKANLDPLLEQLETEECGVSQVAMLNVLTQLYFQMEHQTEGLQLLEKSVELASQIPDGLPLLDDVLENVADLYYGLGEFDIAIAFYLRSVANQQYLHGGVHMEQTTTMSSLSRALYRSHRIDEAIEVQKDVIEIQKQHIGDTAPALVFSLTSLSQMLTDANKLDEAEEACIEVVDLFKNNSVNISFPLAITYCTLASVKESYGKYDEAIDILKKGLDIMEECEDVYPENPAFLSARVNLAELLDQTGRDKEAQDQWYEILAIQESVYGTDSPDIVNFLLAYANSFIIVSKWEEAYPVCDRAVRIVREHFPSDDVSVVIPLQRLSICHYKMKDFQIAEKLAREALSISEKAVINDDDDGDEDSIRLLISEACSNLAAILHTQERDMEAEPLLWRSLKTLEDIYGSNSPYIIPTLESLIVVLHCLKKPESIMPLSRRLNTIKSSSSFA